MAGTLVTAAFAGLAALSLALAAAQEPATTPPAQPAGPPCYPWLAEWEGPLPPTTPLAERFPAPAGWARAGLEPGSFAAWLRDLPVRLDRVEVRTYLGQPVAAPAAAVVALDPGRADLQQCADTILRLHAEYLWAAGRAGEARYHFTSGDLSTWSEWVAGERVEVSGARVRRIGGPRRPADHPSYRRWLRQLFLYAGTLSLGFDSLAVPAGVPLLGGDLFVDPGSPGHAVLLLDLAERADGRALALVGQGYTPAQELHVLADPAAVDRVWFPLPAAVDGSLRVPSWAPFPRRAARRFE